MVNRIIHESNKVFSGYMRGYHQLRHPGPKAMTNVLSRNCREKNMLLIIKARLRVLRRLKFRRGKKTCYIGVHHSVDYTAANVCVYTSTTPFPLFNIVRRNL